MRVRMCPQRAYMLLHAEARGCHDLFLTGVSQWIWLGWARRSQGCSCLSTVASTPHCIQLFKWVLENQTQDLMHFTD